MPEEIDTTLRIIVKPGKPGEPDPGIRLRQWLKLGLRVFGVRVEWAPPAASAHHNERTSRQ